MKSTVSKWLSLAFFLLLIITNGCFSSWGSGSGGSGGGGTTSNTGSDNVILERVNGQYRLDPLIDANTIITSIYVVSTNPVLIEHWDVNNNQRQVRVGSGGVSTNEFNGMSAKGIWQAVPDAAQDRVLITVHWRR